MRDLATTWTIAALIACGGDKSQGTVPDGDADTDADADADTDADTDSDVPYLASRPANPTCLAPDRPTTDARVTVEDPWPSLPAVDRVVQVIQPPDDPSTMWLLRQTGTVYRFADDPAVSTTAVALDITPRVNSSGNELGMLALTFHPDWATNREAFVYYTAGTALAPISILSRFTSTDGGTTLDPSTEEILLLVDQPFSNHNGGMLQFGPDGYLYFGFGDGGSGGDPFGNGQDRFTLLGKFIRIDVDGGSPYTIPPDNPFADGVDGEPEIWAWGFRNPWRWSFDPATGDLWCGDVGQNQIEEIDLVEKGGNYGWNIMEGDACYNAASCDTSGLVLPLETMLHSDGHYAVTGGVVYRGSAIPDLVGKYVWGDYGSGQIWYLDEDPADGHPFKVELLSGLYGLASIDVDLDGEILFTTTNDGVRRLVPNGSPSPSTFPQTLEQTGCFDADLEPLPMLVPYEVAHPFWSDGAEKQRWLSLPDGETLTVDADGGLAFPVGSVVVKQFEVGGRTVETRLMVRHDDGGWAGYAYAWSEDGASATLLPGAFETEGGGGEPWEIPSRGECMRCHNPTAGGLLSATLDQFDFEATQPNGYVENQVDELVRLGMLEASAAHPGALPAVDDTSADLTDRARAYLDVNCAFCHQPGGPGGGNLDLRSATALADTGLCAAPLTGDLGIAGARVVNPGDPSTSILSARMGRRDSNQMPPLATTVVDTVGLAVIDAWITSLPSCP